MTPFAAMVGALESSVGAAAALPAVVTFGFDPIVNLFGVAVRWQTVAVAASIFVAITLAAAIVVAIERRAPAPETAPAETPQPETAPWPVGTEESDRAASGVTGAARLRLDDLLLIAVAGVAGAVAGGRLGYVLIHLEYYRANTAAILDPSQGSLALAGGVVGGLTTSLVVTAILGAPIRRWLAVSIVPLLVGLGLGKLSMALGGDGQGVLSDAQWATAYVGPGPWGSLAAQLPAHPAQVYEALTTLGALGIVVLLAATRRARRHPATLFAVGIGLWALGRFAVAFLWRDPALVGSLNGDQLVTLPCAIAALGGAAVWPLARRRGRRSHARAIDAPSDSDAPGPPPGPPGG